MERINWELKIFFFKVKAEKFQKFAKISNFPILKKTSHATHPLLIAIICATYEKNPSRTVDATKRTRFSKSRPNDLEDIGQGQRSSHATHLLMLVIICIKYGKNPSRTVDATERTRFSRPRPNDLEDIGQGQRSLYATHLLLLVITCARYGKNQLRTEDFFFQGQGRKISKIWNSDSEKNVTRDTPSIDSDHLCQIRKESIQNCRCYKADTIF